MWIWIGITIAIVVLFLLLRSRKSIIGSYIDRGIFEKDPEKAKALLLMGIKYENYSKGHAYLGRVYHSERNFSEAIKHYNLAIRAGYYPVLMDQALIYHYGSSSWNPDLTKARESYYTLAEVGDPYYSALALDKLEQLTEETIGDLKGVLVSPPVITSQKLDPHLRIREPLPDYPRSRSFVNGVKKLLNGTFKDTPIEKDSTVCLMEIRKRYPESELLNTIEKVTAPIHGITLLELLTIILNKDPNFVLNSAGETPVDTFYSLISKFAVGIESDYTISNAIASKFKKVENSLKKVLTENEMKQLDDPEFRETFYKKVSEKTLQWAKKYSDVMSFERIESEINQNLFISLFPVL